MASESAVRRESQPPPLNIIVHHAGIGATDSADLVAQARAETGPSRQLQQTRRELPHPRDGGSSGYPVWFRDKQLAKWYAGEATEVV